MGIRELQAQKAEALEMYHEECARIDAKIDAIRAKRGTKLKDPFEGVDPYGFDAGRDRPRRNGNW